MGGWRNVLFINTKFLTSPFMSLSTAVTEPCVVMFACYGCVVWCSGLCSGSVCMCMWCVVMVW